MLLYAVAVAVGLLLLIIVVKTVLFKAVKISAEPPEELHIDLERAARSLAEAVRIPTVSTYDPRDTDWAQFDRFHAYLAESYPLVHAHIEKETINTYSLLYRWRGRDSSKKPLLLMAHQDVVPVEEGTESEWCFPPFSGEIAEGYVWGRGTLDMKLLLVAIFEAVEHLLAEGFAPAGDIYMFFGHDEEVGGKQGAEAAAQMLRERGLEFDLVIDEGGAIVERAVPEIKRPFALIGTGEKGYANIRLTAEGTGGHSSMPPLSTAVGEISAAVTRLEQQQMKLYLSPPVREFFRRIGPEMKGIKKALIANLWLFGPLFTSAFARTRTGNALLRTTTAATMAQGSPAPNVLPQKASATFNFRILPGNTGEELLQHIRKVTRNPRIKLEVLNLEEPSVISPVDSAQFHLIEKIVAGLYPEALVTPYLVMAGTDSRKFQPLCSNIFRFSAYKLDIDELDSIHGTNERVSLENLESCIKFNILLIKNWGTKN